ncbi:MAG: SAM-dependent methyltransferase, partial [Endomicrobiia bacterium]
MDNRTKSVLYLIPNIISEDSVSRVIPEYNKEIIRTLKIFICEDIRTTRRFLKSIDKTIDINQILFFELNKHTKDEDKSEYLNPCEKGESVGLISEAGLPCIADPGNIIVKIAHQKDIRVVPLSGPSSIFMALMSSGFNGQNFAFIGYLPMDKTERFK